MTITEVRSLALATLNASPNSAGLLTVTAWAPIDAAWASKSTANGSGTVGQSLIKLLKLSLPVLFCNLLITAKPPLSSTSTISFFCVKTLEYKSEFNIR